MVIASVLGEAISHAISEIASSAEEQQTQDDGSFKDVRTFVRRSEDTLDNSFQLTQNQFRKIPRLAAVLPAPTKEEPYGTQKKNSKRNWSVVESAMVGCL
jgi:hypothetical protein